MKTSVIIPVYNREAFIEIAIRSLLLQRDAANLDIIVVDDGSTDRTTEIIVAISQREPCVRLIRQPKAGVARARNNGLANVPPDADFVTFLDSDDISVPGRFAAEIPLFREDPELAMTYSLLTLADSIDDVNLVPAPDSTTCTLRGISLTTAIFRKTAIDTLGSFNEALTQSEDSDFLFRFFEGSLKYRFVDNVSIIYRRHPGNTTKDKEQARRSFLQAMLMSAQRRRRNPTIRDLPRFFDFTELFDERNTSLR